MRQTKQTRQTDIWRIGRGAAPTAAVIFKNQTKVITLENCPNFLNYHTVDMLRYTVEKAKFTLKLCFFHA